MQLTRNEDFKMMLIAVADGEEVTSEQYPGDTFYSVLNGNMPLVTKDKTYVLHTSKCMAMKDN